jgi:glycine betaine/proline transport system substrate-binding protein
VPRIQLGTWVNDAVDWLTTHMGWLFDFCKTVFLGLYDGINAVLQAPQPLLLAGIFAVVAFWLRGTLAGVLTFVGFAFIDSLELWENAMVTMSLMSASQAFQVLKSPPVPRDMSTSTAASMPMTSSLPTFIIRATAWCGAPFM